jgi:hypothetical protein
MHDQCAPPVARPLQVHDSVLTRALSARLCQLRVARCQWLRRASALPLRWLQLRWLPLQWRLPLQRTRCTLTLALASVAGLPPLLAPSRRGRRGLDRRDRPPTFLAGRRWKGTTAVRRRRLLTTLATLTCRLVLVARAVDQDAQAAAPLALVLAAAAATSRVALRPRLRNARCRSCRRCRWCSPPSLPTGVDKAATAQRGVAQAL